MSNQEMEAFNNAVMGGIKNAIQQAAEEEIMKAKQNLEDRISEIVSQVVMNIHRYFEVQNYTDRIVIEVKKEL